MKRVVNIIGLIILISLTACNGSEGESSPKMITSPNVNDAYIQKLAVSGEKVAVINVKLLSEYGERIANVLQLKSVEVCSIKTCFSTKNILSGKSKQDFYDDKKGFTVAEVAISEFDSPITHIKLNSQTQSTGSKFTEIIQFPENKFVESSLYYLALISVDEQVTNKQKNHSYKTQKKWYSQLVPNLQAFVPISGTDKVYFYDKQQGLKITTDSGFLLSMDTETFNVNRVISFKETPHEIVASYYLEADSGFKINKPALINIPLNEGEIPADLTIDDYELTINNKPEEFRVIEIGGKKFIELSIKNLGVINFLKKRILATPPSDLSIGVKSYDKTTKKRSTKSRTTTCLSDIAQLKSTADWYAENHGYYYFNFCESIAPYVNIAYINLDRAHNSYNSPYSGKSAVVSFSYQPSNGFQNTYDLKTISEHAIAKNAKIAINGFTWDPYSSFSVADRGRVAFMGRQLGRGKGHFKGTVYDNHVALNKHPNNGEASIGFAIPDHIDNIKSKFYHRPSGDIVSYPYTDKLYSSTTSVLKNGVCNITATNPGELNAWSAVGINAGKLLFISSFNSNPLNTKELCDLFQGFGITNALRNDGSTAASLYVDGRHVNPLTGAARNSIGGSARRVLHAITVKVN